MANSHKRRNNIERIRIKGVCVNGEEEARIGIVNAFKELLSDPGVWRASLEGLNFSKLEELEAARLELPFSKEEVHIALFDLNGDKAPRPDGFTTNFWQFSWDIVKLDIMDFFKDFHKRGRFGKSPNSTFFGVDPKKGGAEELKYFRPISLVGSVYKLIAKVLANRLKKVMHGLVNTAQNAFVEGRQILDTSLIANEVIDSILRKKEKGLLCKSDIERAYDKIDWSFVLNVLQRMGFGEKWSRWIKWCISTTSFSILVNGSPVGFYGSSTGSRQGDPPSP